MKLRPTIEKLSKSTQIILLRTIILAALLMDKAEASYIAAIQLDSIFAKAYNNLGAILAEKGEPGAAEQYFQKAIELEPHNGSAHHIPVNIRLKGHQQYREGFATLWPISL